MKYKHVALCDVCDLIAGYAFKSRDFGNYNTKVIKIAQITPPSVDMDSLSGVDIAKYDTQKLQKYIAQKGDFVFAMTGATIGKIGRIESGSAYINQRVLLFKNRSIIDKDYLYYVLQQYQFEQYILSHIDSHSAQPNISARTVGNYTFLLPDIDTQRKVGKFLRALDANCEIHRHINDNLEQQAAALFESWFVNYDPWDGVQPSEWENAPLGSFVEIKRGGSPRPIQDFLSDSGLRWLKISDVTSLSSPFVLEIKEHIKEEGLRKTVFLHAGELVLSNSATPGIPKILDVDTCIHDGWLYFPKSELSKYYLYLFFKHIRKELVALGNGSVFTNLKTDILKAFPATKADEATLKEFDALVTPLFDAMLNADRENFKLAAMRDALLPKLMSSEIDVSEVEL